MFDIQADRLVRCCDNDAEEVCIPETVTTVGAHAFENHPHLRSIVFSSAAKTIGDDAFAGCSQLESSHFADGLKRLGNGCFRNCISLRRICLPDTVASVHPRAFQGCKQLADVRLSAGLRRNIESQTFGGCTALEEIMIPPGIQRIKSGAFSGCTALKKIHFENADIQIEKGAFADCIQLDAAVLTFIEEHVIDESKLDINSRAAGAAGRLSNYTKRSFVLDGVRCGSIEGVLQSFKCPDPERQTEICALTGGWAKHAGSQYDWKKDHRLFWRGQTFDRRSEAYQQLLDRLYNAVYDQDEGFRKDLAEIAERRLDHRMGLSNPDETVLTRHEFVLRLERLAQRTNKQG